MALEEDLKQILLDYNYNIVIKDEQLECIQHLEKGENVFAQLPTGYGKSLIYTLYPLYKEKKLRKKQTALVVSPLKSLMKDQVDLLRSHGILCEALVSNMTQESMKNVRSGNISVLFASPEAVELMVKDRSFEQLKGQFCLLAFDEAHCISQWGLDFRSSYRRVAEVVSLVEDIPTLALTATATRDIYRDICSVLAMSDGNTHLVARIPDRPNIYLHMEKASQDPSKSLDWLVDTIKRHGRRAKKAIVYTTNMRQCEQIYMWLMSELGSHAYANEVKRTNRLVDMVHSKTEDGDLKRILKEFPEGTIRVVVATVAFGLGIQVEDIDVIINWGMESLLVYWQEVGRCARDGHQGFSLMYAYPRSINDCSDEVVKKILADRSCIRSAILKNFQLPGMEDRDQDFPQCDGKCVECQCRKCMCCSFCAESCRCRGESIKVTDRLLSTE